MENKYNAKLGEITRKMLCDLRNNNDNIVFSPVSLLMLLGMLADSAGGETRNEIIRVMSGDCYEDVMKWIKELEMELALSEKVMLANAVFIRPDLKDKITPGYEDRLKNICDGRLFAKDGSESISDQLDEYEPEPHVFPSEEEKRVYAKRLFRKIAKRIHPGMNPLYDTSKRIQDLYVESQNAYKECDVRMLDIIDHEVELILKE